MLLWARLLPIVSVHKRMGPLLEMLIKIVTRDVVDWLGLMILVMLTFISSMWFLFGGRENTSMFGFDSKFRNWYTSFQALFGVVLESTQLDQAGASDGSNSHPEIAWYEPPTEAWSFHKARPLAPEVLGSQRPRLHQSQHLCI